MKLAIAGNGLIVGEALKALKYVPSIEVVSIFVRPQSIEKGEKIATENNIKEIFTDYDKMLRESDADFIYIANINSVHYTYALKALNAGKNVIIEKPICVTYEEFRTVSQVAQSKGLFIFEAVTFLHAPFFKEIGDIIPSLGRICSIQCNYSKYSSRYDRYKRGDIAPVFDPEAAGGALLDLNIYSINFVTSLFGAPLKTTYYRNNGYNGIDISGTLILNYDGFTATCTAAKDSYSPCFDIIQGEEGYLMIHGSPDNLSKVEIHTKNTDKEFTIASEHHRMVDEFTEFEQIFRTGDMKRCLEYLKISSDSIKVADAALK